MRLGILVAAVVLTAGCGGGSGDDPGTVGPGPGNVTPGPGTNPGTTPDPGTTPEQPNPSDNETAIVFFAQQEEGQEVTRAGSPLEDRDGANVRSFKVWGYKNMSNGDLQIVFPGYTVNYVSAANSTTTNTDGWEYVDQQGDNEPEQTIKYWDWNVSAYRFFGVTGGLSGTYTSDDNKERYEIGIHISIPDLSIQIPDEADDIDDAIKAIPLYSRLWYSTGIESEDPSRLFGKPVQLEFVRPVSKVRIMFTSSDPNVSLADLDLSDPLFMPADEDIDIVIKGTFTVSYPLNYSLNSGEISETWSVVRDNPDDAVVTYLSTIIGRDDVWNTVLPAKGQGMYKLTVKVSDEPKECYVPAEFVNWQPGYEYTYIFKVNEEGGVEFGGVYSAYTDWVDGPETGHTVHNW